MSIWHVDLMTGITIPGQERGKPGKGVPALDKQKVENLPAKWDEEFRHSHLNVSFDKPVTVWLRVSPVTVSTQGAEKTVVNYTFLHDWFGDHFQYIRTEKEPPYGRPQEFWDGHFDGAVLPVTENQFKAFFSCAADCIKSRGERMVCELKKKMKGACT